MALPVPSFAALTAGDQPLSLFDQQFTAIAQGGTIACTASGQNTIVLTPNPNNFVPTIYTDGAPRFVWVQQATTTMGPVTINVAGIGPMTGYKQNGAVALGSVSGELVAGNVYTGTFSSALTAGAGGIAVDLNAPGPPGPPGTQGPPGPTGAAGGTLGLPAGGAANFVLAKNSAADYDTSWQAIAGGGVGSFNGRIGAVTLVASDVTGAGGAPIASPSFSGTPLAPTAAPGTNTAQVATTQFVEAAVAAAAAGTDETIMAVSLAVSAASGALTIALKNAAGNDATPSSPINIGFRDGTVGAGLLTTLSITGPLSITIPSAATLGVHAGGAFRVWVVVFNNAGTPALGVIVCGGFFTNYIQPLNEGEAAATVALTATSTSARTFYTPVAIASAVFRIIGYLEWSAAGLVTAGTWTTTNLIRNRIFGAGVPKPGQPIGFVWLNVQPGGSTSSSTYTTMASITHVQQSAANMVKISIDSHLQVSEPTGGAGINSQAIARVVRGSTTIGPSHIFGAISAAGAAIQLDTVDAYSFVDWPNAAGNIVYSQQVAWNVGPCTVYSVNIDLNTQEVMT